MASRVEKRIALARLFLRMDRLESVMPTREASSEAPILRFAITTSRLTMIGNVVPPHSDCQVVFFLILDRGLEEIGKDRREQRQQQEDDGDDKGEEGLEEGGKKLHQHGDDQTGNADDPQIGHVVLDKGFAAADVHGEQPCHCERDKHRHTDGIEHGDHDPVGGLGNLHGGMVDVQIHQPGEGDINHDACQKNQADKEAGHVAEIEGEKFFELVHAVIGSFLWFIMTMRLFIFDTKRGDVFYVVHKNKEFAKKRCTIAGRSFIM